MPVYSIEEIMAVKDRYREKPYADFSIQNVCQRVAPASLVRGENAFRARRAVNQDEAVRKMVQSALNRLNEDNFDEIAEGMQTEMMLERSAIKVLVHLAFEKALQEPAYCHIYARLCYIVARFEVTVAQADPTSPSGQPVSHVRNAIIERAQSEFQEKDEFVAPEGASPEAADEALTRFIRRKKSNIKFVGHLFLARVLSAKVMLLVISQLAGTADEDGNILEYPSELSIELLIELLEIAGEKLESMEEPCVVEVFDLLEKFLQKKPKYTHRVHFKIMDCIDTRNNGWVSRAAARGNNEPSPSTRRPTASKPSVGPSPASAATPTGRGKNAFPTAPAASGTPQAPGATATAAASKEQGAWKNILVGKGGAPAAGAAAPSTAAAAAPEAAAKPTTAAAVVAAAAKGPSAMASAFSPIASKTLRDVAKKVDEVRARWSHPDPTLARTWTDAFAEMGLSAGDLTAAVILSVATRACTTTKSYAQAEAAGFLSCGLGLSPEEVLPGLTRTLVNGVVEGIVEDAPKFNQRLVRVLEDTHRAAATGQLYEEGSEIAPLKQDMATAVACGLARVLLYALDGLKEVDYMDDLVAEALMPVWKRLPMAEGATLDEAALVETIGEVGAARGATNPLALAAAAEMLSVAKEAGWIKGPAVAAWMAKSKHQTLVGFFKGKGFGAK